MASSNRRENADPTSEKGETDVTVGLENSEGENKTNMNENSANVQQVILGSFKVEGYQMEVTVKKVGSIWLLKCGDKEVQHKEEIRQIEGLDFHDDILIIGEKAYQLKEENGCFLLDIVDDTQMDQENNRSESFNGDDSGDEKEIVSVNPCIGPSHQMLQLSNQNSQNTQSHQNSNVYTSQSTEMEDIIGTRVQSPENLSGSDMTSNTDLVKTAENTSRASDQSLTDKTSKHIAGASPALPPACPNSSVSSTDDYENVSNLLSPGEDPQSANRSTSIKDNSGAGKSTLSKKPIPSPRQHKENDKDKSSEPHALPKKQKAVSLDKEDGAPENGTSATPPPRELGQSQENPCETQKSEETISGRKNEANGKEYEIHLLVKYWKSKHFSSDLSTTCNLDTYLRWHYVLENSQALNEKLDQLKARNIHVTVEKEEEDLWVNIDLGKREKKLSESDSERIKSTVMEALTLDTEIFVTNSFPAVGIDKNEAVKLIMKKSREEMRNELWLYPDEDTDFIHYVYPATRSSEVDTCIQEVTKFLQEGEGVKSLQLVFSKLFEQNSVKQEMKRIFKVTLAIDCLESENSCKVTIKGRMSEVEKGWSWINVKFLDNYIVNEISFKDIKKLGTNISEEMIVEDVLSQPGFEHVTWCINESCKKIGICSTDRFAVDNATAALKRGIKREEFPLEFYQSLYDVQAVKEGRAILEKTDSVIQAIGTDKALTWMKQFVEKLQSNGQENKTIKQDQINKYNSQNQYPRVMETTVSVVVDDLQVFERLCDSEKLKACADKHSVILNRKETDKRGFLLTGSSDGCVKVKEMLNQMINQENDSLSLAKEHWTLSFGHDISVQYPTNLLDVNLKVGVDIVPPEQANFDRGQKTLHLPKWIDGCKKEKEKTEICLREVLMLSLDESFYKIQIDLPEMHKKITKHFTHRLFALLSGKDFEGKPPIELFICTNSKDMYTVLIESCKQSIQMPPSTFPRSASVPVTHETPKPDIEISVIIGQLNGTQADVIVNTTNTDLDLSSGMISQALLKSAGRELQSEVKEKYPNGIQFGEIVVTKGYGLQGCRFVFHGALDFYYNVKNVKGIHRFVLDCLSEAEKQKCATIAFPAIGTGKLGYPKREVAQSMFCAVRKFEDSCRHLKEVKFVIYHQDKEAVMEFRKQEECHNMKRSTNEASQIQVYIEYGLVTDIKTEGMIYIWETKSTFKLKVKDHALLQHVGNELQQMWALHRDEKETRHLPLTTPGGQLRVLCIIHIFCSDDITSFKKGMREGLQKAHDCDSVTVFFDKSNKFLRYGDQIVDVFQTCIKEIQKSNTKIHYISVTIDNKNLASKFHSLWNSYPASKRATGRTSASPVKNTTTYKEPENQSIDDRGDVRIGGNRSNQKEIWNKEKGVFLIQEYTRVSDKYVKIENIPATYTEGDLEKDVKYCCPELQYSIIFVQGMSEAILKCKDENDATQLVCKGSEKVRFTQFPLQSMTQFSTKVEYVVGEQTVRALIEKDIQAEVEKGKTCITAPTELQLKYALVKLEKTKSDQQRTRDDSEGFVDIIEVTEDIWDIVETLKRKEITALREQGYEISYHGGHITFSDLKEKNEVPYRTVVKSYVESLKHMQILEVKVKENNVDTIKKWCSEIQMEQKKECCVFVKKRGTVFVFDDSYENLQKIKHRLLFKDGQIKVTGRRKRMFNEMSPDYSAVKETEPHNLDHNALPVVEAEAKSHTDRNHEKRGPSRLEKKKEFSLELQAKNLQAYNTAESINVYVYEANILKLPVDCIVNAANDTLRHGGGVAKVIAVAAGRSLDKEGFDYIRKHGQIPVGKTCVTTAGNLHYDCVIHAVGPCWSDYRPHSLYDVQKCEKDLYSAIMESFLAAEKRSLESIALPAISAAIFGVPEELCVYHYAKATIDYSKRMSPKALKEIHFIDINSKIIRRIQDMFDAFLKSKRNPDYSTDKFVQTKVKPSRPRSKSPEVTEVRGSGTDSKCVYTNHTDGLRHIIDTQKCRLVIQLGDIMQIKASAIVSIEDSKGSGRGKISKLIEGKMIGRSKDNYLEKKKEVFSTDKETGDVIVTDGFNSGYKYILHTILPYDIRNFHPVDRENTVKQSLENILRTIIDLPADSIVMCLLGAGEETKEEIDVATDAFIKTFKTFCEKKRVQSKHLQITLVCRQGNILNWVMQKFRDRGIIEDYTQAAPPVPPRPTKRSESLTEDNDNKESLEDCVICMEKITKRKVLKCGHAFDKDCIKQAFRVKKVCPTCGMVCGKLTGDQPEGKMKVNIETYSHCAGYEQCGRITITYTFQSGKQGPDHPNPGRDYKGITRIAYLPDNDEGNEVLEMLRLAFDRKLIFTIGTSRTTGEEGVITWNDIHHKTDPKPNTQFGYPDPTYLARVKDELSAKGITPEDICKAH